MRQTLYQGGRRKKEKWEPASPGLASNGKPLRLTLFKCQMEAVQPGRRGPLRGFSLETKTPGGPMRDTDKLNRSLPPLRQ